MSQLFFQPLKYTAIITIPSFLISMIFGVILGTIAGYNKGKFIDGAINIFVILFNAMPSFILAALALLLGPKIGLPVSFIRYEDGGMFLMLKSCIIPIAVLVLAGLAITTYLTRNEVVGILESNHVLIARSKGLSEVQVFKKHVFRNMVIPLVGIFLNGFLIFLGGSLVIETFFQIPGSSYLIVNAVSNAEYDIVMFNTLFFTGLGLVLATITDVTYVFIDPRIKYASANE
jgi:oligopeptide transport system permease protein